MNKKLNLVLIVCCAITNQTLIPAETTANPTPERRNEWLFSVCCPSEPRTASLSELYCTVGFVCWSCCCNHWNRCDCGCCPDFCYRLPCCFDPTIDDSERDLIREQNKAGSANRQTRITTLITTQNLTQQGETELKKLAQENPALHRQAVETTRALAIQEPQPAPQEMNV